MTNDQRRMLTEFLGECWHEIKRPKSEPTVFHQPCLHCGKTIYVIRDKPIERYHTFLTWQDLGDVKKALVREGMWWDFTQHCKGKYNGLYGTIVYDINANFTNWLFREVDEKGEPHFCRLVAEFTEGRK